MISGLFNYDPRRQNTIRPLHEKWDKRLAEIKLVNPGEQAQVPHHRGRHRSCRGVAAAASLGELGYNVDSFCFQDTPRRGHSIAAQGGINAAKNYPNDGDSIERLFIDTIKGGDFRSREANVYRLAQVSTNIIDQCVAQGVPFARDYAGYLDNRSFGGALVSRTFYARGQTGQQLLLGAYGALMRQIKAGTVTLHPRTEMLDLVVVDGHAKGITVRDLVTGQDRVLCRVTRSASASGGYANVFYLSTNAMGSNVTAAYRAYKKGAFFANPCFTQIHPTCIPVTGDHQSKLTLMSESLRNDGRIWVPKNKGDKRQAGRDPRSRPRLLSRAKISSLRQPCPARHLLPRRKGSLRRRQGRRSGRPRRVPRFRRLHQATRGRHDPRALRQSVRDV